MIFPKIVSLKPIKKYELDIEFANGVRGIYDLSFLAGKGVFKSWDVDRNFFEVKVNSQTGAITWPGDIDLDTLTIYCAIKGISPEEYFKLLKEYAPNQ